MTNSQSILSLEFFRRPAAKVARDLVGKKILRSYDGFLKAAIITETEAYEGTHDLASHSSRGRTARTEVMFGPAGCFYIYRIYGLHWMLNVVTGDVDEAAAVLIRSIEGVNGPGRVATALGIDNSLNGLAACPAANLWFETGDSAARKLSIRRTARIGVEYAGPIWAEKKLRFIRS